MFFAWLMRVLERSCHRPVRWRVGVPLLIAGLCVAFEGSAQAQLVVTDSLTPQALVTNLLGGGVTASNIAYKGTPTSSGTFTGGNGIIGFDSGIILSSGKAKDVVGPNNSGGQTTALSVPGDTDLDAIVTPNKTNDATVLEFDFVPQGNTLTFQYVFGSEEYNEFANTSFNDVFAFLLDGKNIALLPGGTTAVSINTVNQTKNPTFYKNNSTPNPPSPLINTQLDGLTVVLTATAPVTAGSTHHIKLAIADTSDSALDSDVFIKATSFSTVVPPTPAPVVIPPPPPKPAKLVAFAPLRYKYNAKTGQYSGAITIVNQGDVAATGTNVISFPALQFGINLANAAGLLTTTNAPILPIPGTSIPGHAVIRVTGIFDNPQKVHLSTFFEHYTIKVVTTGP